MPDSNFRVCCHSTSFDGSTAVREYNLYESTVLELSDLWILNRQKDRRRQNSKGMAPRARFELATLRLTAECSTVELPGNGQVGLLIYISLQRGATLHTVNLSLA